MQLIELDESLVTIEYFHPLMNGGAAAAGFDAAAAGSDAGTAESTAPIDLWGQLDTPALPIGLLPEVIERFAIEEGRLMGADAGGLALGALAVCAAALSDRIRLQVKQYDRNWTEPARIWVGLIGPPSTKKSPIIARVTARLKQLDKDLWRDYLAAQATYDALPGEQQKTAERPKQRRLRLEDTTVEAALEVFKDSPDGVLCIQPELSGWFGAMDKYTGSHGAAKDRSVWLLAYDGGSYVIHRIKRGAGLVENLSASLLGGIQPDPLRKIADETVDDGLLQRLIPIVLHPGAVGTDEPNQHLASQRYDDLINRLHYSTPPPNVLRFSAAAQSVRAELEQKHFELMLIERINKKLASHIGKYDGLFARLCVLWHCIDGGGQEIAEATARRVGEFMHRFLLPHAVAFYADMLGLADSHDRLKAVAGHVLAHKLERVTNRTVQRGDRTMRGLTRQDTEKVFEQLEALGWLTRVPGPRPALPPHWLVNPEVHRLFAERAKREATERVRVVNLMQELVAQKRASR